MVLHHSKRFSGPKSLRQAKQGRKSTPQWGSYETKAEYFFPQEDITFCNIPFFHLSCRHTHLLPYLK